MTGCEGCKFVTTRAEMVVQGMSITVDACKLNLTPAMRCNRYAISFLRQVARALRGWIE